MQLNANDGLIRSYQYAEASEALIRSYGHAEPHAHSGSTTKAVSVQQGNSGTPILQSTTFTLQQKVPNGQVNHEDMNDMDGQPPAERDMDQSNNASGRELGASNAGKCCDNMCTAALQAGELSVLEP